MTQSRDDDQAKKVMDHLVGLLLTLRHPGAFCAIEEPLRRVALAMFQSGNYGTRTYPETVLKGAVEDCLLQPEIQVTRRSAGLPICITAILTALSAVKGGHRLADGARLMAIPAEAMLGLLANLDLDDASPGPAIVHALNILRALFRNGDLDFLSAAYVTRAYAACFNAFNSASWSVRNSAMMLFGALVRRTFGSCPPQSDILFTGQHDLRKVAIKFPGLVALLETQIKSASTQDAHIYPILSVLQRTKLSTGAITAHQSFYEAALTFLTQTCLASKTAKTRAMAARLLVNSLLLGAPEIVWPALKRHTFALLQSTSANELASKLDILNMIADNKLVQSDLKQFINENKDLLTLLGNDQKLPCFIRLKALSLLEDPAVELADYEAAIHAPLQPYQFELISLIQRHTSVPYESTEHKNIHWRMIKNDLETTTELASRMDILKLDGGSPGCVKSFPERYTFMSYEPANDVIID